MFLGILKCLLAVKTFIRNARITIIKSCLLVKDLEPLLVSSKQSHLTSCLYCRYKCFFFQILILLCYRKLSSKHVYILSINGTTANGSRQSLIKKYSKQILASRRQKCSKNLEKSSNSEE